MRTARREPVAPPKAIARKLAKARKTKEKLALDLVSLFPPTVKNKSWRLRVSVKGQPMERSARDIDSEIYAAFLDLTTEVNKGRSKRPGSKELLSKTLEKYLQQRGPKSEWRGKTPKNRRQDFNHLIELAKIRRLTNADLDAVLIREFLSQATASSIRAKTLLSVVRTFVLWGVGTGKFTREQLDEISTVIWAPPEGSSYGKPLSRREQSKMHFGTDDRLGGEIPTHEQIDQFAKELQRHFKLGEALVHVSANIGTRIRETLILTASKDVHNAGRGNFVDVKNECVKVHWQRAEEDSSKAPTKNQTFRSVVIPPAWSIATGFDVLKWLQERCKEALLEQKQGTNPDALIFPNSHGEAFTYNAFYSVYLRKTYANLDWFMPQYFDAKGKARRMARFTIHSTRDRFAQTAAYEWGYFEHELMEQGGWSDAKTIKKFYLGTTDATHLGIKRRHLALATKRPLKRRKRG